MDREIKMRREFNKKKMSLTNHTLEKNKIKIKINNDDENENKPQSFRKKIRFCLRSSRILFYFLFIYFFLISLQQYNERSHKLIDFLPSYNQIRNNINFPFVLHFLFFNFSFRFFLLFVEIPSFDFFFIIYSFRTLSLYKCKCGGIQNFGIGISTDTKYELILVFLLLCYYCLF